MDNIGNQVIKTLNTNNLNRLLLGILASAIILGGGTGYLLANSKGTTNTALPINKNPKTAEEDNRTFRDFAEGTIQKRSESKNPSEYTEGTHVLEREGAVPVALTSSVIDLSEYEGKKVKVLGETQKAIKEGWLMDVGKVEEKQ